MLAFKVHNFLFILKNSQLVGPLCWQGFCSLQVYTIPYLCVFITWKHVLWGLSTEVTLPSLSSWRHWNQHVYSEFLYDGSLKFFHPTKMSITLVLLCFLLWASVSLCSCVGVARLACYTRLNSSVRNDRYFGGISIPSLPSVCTHEHTTLTHTHTDAHMPWGTE